MNNKTLIFVISIIIILIGGYLLISSRQQQPPQPTEQPTISTTTEETEQPATATTTGEAQQAPAAEEGKIREIVVEGTEFSFNPSKITAKKGEKIRIVFKNVGSIAHDLEVEGHGLEIKTKLTQPGETDSIEFTVPESGTYEFYCTVPGHRPAGMEGELIAE